MDGASDAGENHTTVTVQGYQADLFQSEGTILLTWQNEAGYLFMLRATDFGDTETLLSMAEGVVPYEGPGVAWEMGWVPEGYEPMYRDAADLTVELLDAFAQGQVGEIYLAYTSFKNTVSQTPKLMKLLPVELEEQQEEDRAKAQALMTYEPDAEGVLDSIVPKYMSSLIYGALLEAVASENGARMTAMDSATSNAEEMIESLSLQYNRARQGAITQELTEIVAGANAIS